jgi:SAM-dependent methyltransferase
MNENIYGNFARYYAHELYAQFSSTMLEEYGRLAETYGLSTSGKLLDVACGNGVFGIGMAQRGWQVTGVDQSPTQIALAVEQGGDLPIDWRVGDMRELAFENEFDFVTCWFDSLNYMLTPEDLKSALRGMYNALKPGGSCVFDMNTIYGIMVNWQRNKDYLQVNTPELVEIHHNDCDWEQKIAHLHITIFDRGARRPDGSYEWNRMDEIHTERAYPVTEIRVWLKEIGFNVVDILGSLQEFIPPRAESTRVWFVCRK